MVIRVAFAGESHDDLARDLLASLNADRGQWGPALLIEGPPPPGTLGPVVDALEIAIGATGSLASLAAAIVAWLQYRKPDVKLTIIIDGQENPEYIGAAEARENPPAVIDTLTARLSAAAGQVPGSARGDGSAG